MRYLTYFLIFLYSANSFSLSIISDLDDTLKITNVLDRSEATRNALFSKKAFYGSSQLLSEMGHYTDHLYVVSGTTNFLTFRVKSFLNFNNINYKDLFLRDIIRQDNISFYKTQIIEKLLEENPSEDFILIGDNTEKDGYVYDGLKVKYPNRIKSIYIKQIKKKDGLKRVRPFYSVADLAMYEYLDERMSFSQVASIIKDLAFAKNFNDLFPGFTHCPVEMNEFPEIKAPLLKVLNDQLRRKIIFLCKRRKVSQDD